MGGDTDLIALDEAERTFAALLAEGIAIPEAAHQAGVSRATGYRWAKEPRVAEVVAEAQREIRAALVRKITGLGYPAITTLERAMTDPTITSTQVAAANSVLDRVGVSKQEIHKYVGDAAEPIVIESRVPFNPLARAEQEQRRLARENAIDADFKEIH